MGEKEIKQPKISRRVYLKYATIVAIGAIGSVGILWNYGRKGFDSQIEKTSGIPTPINRTIYSVPQEKKVEKSIIDEGQSSLVSIIRGNSDVDIEKMVRKSIDAIGGIEKIVSPGDSVVVKPPILTSNAGCSPDPRVVAAVAKIAIEAGGNVVVAESSGNGNTAYNLSKLGITSAAESVGAEVKDLQTENEVQIEVPNGLALDHVKTYPTIQNCDVLISVPRLKRHSSATVTISLKNMMGILPRNEMRRFHSTDLSQCIADLGTVIRPDLSIVDASYAMTRTGPTSGDMTRLDTIMASLDPVAVDRVGAYELEKLEEKIGLTSRSRFDSSNIRHITAAGKLGVGESLFEKIKTIEEFVE